MKSMRCLFWNLTLRPLMQLYSYMYKYSHVHLDEDFMEPKELERVARQIRLRDVQAVFEAGAGHVGGEMSAIDVMTALYFRVLRIWPDDPKNPARDRFVLSKGIRPAHFTSRSPSAALFRRRNLNFPAA